MMNLKKKCVSVMLSAACLLSMASCGIGKVNKNDSKTDDPTKANISLMTWDGGIGKEWLDKAAALFEEKYKDSTDFQEGRKGVKINIEKSRNCAGSSLETSMTYDIYFTESVNYYKLVNDGMLADLTEIMTTPLTDYGDDKTILSKIDPSYASFLETKDDKYYAIPFYDSFYSLVYDIDLWKNKGFYISKDGDFTKNLKNLSVGRDGVSGTSDDGLPATYEEFAKLMKKLRDDTRKPILYCANGTDYVANFLYNYWTDYEGLDEMMLNYTFEGTAKDLINVSDDGTVTKLPETKITFANGYDLQKQAGKYYALKFMQDVICNNPDNYEMIESHTAAQKLFVNGGVTNSEPNAMLIEGSWWENEAASAFATLAENGDERHNYAIMPIPCADSSKLGTKETRVSLSSSYGLVNKNTQNMKLALEFMKFLHTDIQLSAFTAETSMLRALNYEVLPEDEAKLTTYAKSNVEIKEKANVIYPYSSRKEVINNDLEFANFAWAWKTSAGNNQKNPMLYFTAKDLTGQSAEKYFNGIYDYFKTRWNTISSRG